MNELVFIYGALRSGTTIFRLMLDAHRDLSNPGEVDFIFDHLMRDVASSRWTYDFKSLRLDRIFQSYNLNLLESKDGDEIAVDLINQFRQRAQGHFTLNIHRNLDKVAAIFPKAKIIHIIRDPRDVAKSCIGMGWAGTTYYGIDQWLETESSWDQFAPLFDKKDVMSLFFEDLIASPTAKLGEVCSFLRVQFLPEMLNYPNHSTYQAPDPSAILQWTKALSAREVALAELRAKQMLLDRHYELSGYPLDPPDWRERLSLWWTNKAFVWKFGCRRYGWYNFIFEKLTRKFVRSLHPLFVLRMNEIVARHLK